MAKISELVKAIADVTGFPHGVVNLYARRLTDAGLLPKSRGRRYAQASPEHAAVLIIAMLSTDQPADAPRIVQKYGSMIHYGSRQFLPFMVSLIDGASRFDTEIWRLLWCTEFCFERKPNEWIWYRATPLMRGQRLDTAWFAPEASARKKSQDKKQNIRIEASMSGQAISRIGAFFANMPHEEAHMGFLRKATVDARNPAEVDYNATLDKLLPQPRRPAKFD